ncbi:hypothetical protein HY772_05550 [Candidatus Woesearchaeota archaeon]|nr:hypothetical protein [Candidatus Woesearchaeota archaeon]
MSYRTHTTWERLYKAVRCLARGTDSIQKRLYYASLELAPLQAEEFPEELRDSIPFVYRPNSDGFTEESFTNMTVDVACKLAEEIVDAYDTVARDYCVPDK